MMPVDQIFKRQLWGEVRNAGITELLDHRDRLTLNAQLTDELPHCEIERTNERLDAVSAELHRRRKAAEVNPGGPNLDDERYRRWCALASEIRERCDLPTLFERLGYLLQPAGHNSRRNAAEWAGACPLCAGTDRLRVWSGPNGRAWCRICGWSADAIVATRSLDRTLTDFYPAVQFLADWLGLTLPNDDAPPAAKSAEVVSISPRVTFLPMRNGGGRRSG